MNKIKKTRQYDQFRSILGNRQLSREHINLLKVEIERNNLLQVCPIITNEHLEVIDGQHRLEAAKQLGLEIPYVVVPGLGVEHVVRMNTSQKKWMIKDFIQLHVDLGNQDYIEMVFFMEEYKVTPTIAILLLSRQVYTRQRVSDFREGRWSITRYDEAVEIAEVMRKFVPKMKSSVISRSSAFAAAMVKAKEILEKNDLSLDDLLEQAQKSQVMLSYSVRVRDYLQELEEMINYNRKSNLIRLV